MAYPTPSYPLPPAPAQQDSHIVQELSMPIFQARGWLKFLGVLSIIGGIGQALSIVGILIAWLPIWMGVLMFQAGSSVESAGQFGDKFAFLRSLSSLKTYFVLQGVLTLLGILVGVSMLCIMFILPLLGVTLLPWQDIINNSIYY
ncbi:MAG: DUF5362 domain-containing protein [Chloroflexota bacterium]